MNHNASRRREREPNRHQKHPEDVAGDENRIADGWMTERDRVEENDGREHLTAERRGVGEHETVVNVIHVHGYLLMLLPQQLNVCLRYLSPVVILQKTSQRLVHLHELMTEDLRQHKRRRLRKYVCR